jgi:CIC family chloride channel protein
VNTKSHKLQKLFLTARSRLTRPQYIIVIAVLTGFSAGVTGVILKSIVHYLRHFLLPGRGFYFLLPAVGIFCTVLLVQIFYNGQFEKGIALVLKAIAKKSSYIPTGNTYRHVLTSTLTVGLGGSAGLEAPIVATGSSFGSLFGRITDLNYQERTLMLACGAAAGISAVFNAPIAGVIFAIEVLLAETLVSYFIPLMIASVTGVLCSKIILQENILFNFILKKEFDYHNVPFYLLLGIVSGFLSLYYARSFKFTERKLQSFQLNPYLKAISGGLLLAGIIYLFPPLFGEGYRSVTQLSNVNLSEMMTGNFFNISDTISLLLFLGLIMLLKPIAVAITLGSGGNGGNFAPSLFTGSFLGFFFSRLLNSFGVFKIPEGNFSLVAMAGMLSGVMYCPLTAIFLIAEITNGYGLFIPLMIVSALSFFIVKHFEPYSMDLKKLAEEGEMFTHKKEQNILTTISLESVLSDEYQSIHIHKKFNDFVELIKTSDKNIFAVVKDNELFAGIIELNDTKKLLFERDKHDKLSIRSITKRPRAVIYIDDSLQKVMEKMDTTQSWYLPVLTRDKKFVSFISKSKLFNRYRQILTEQQDLYEK